jgi:hypothetical protein
MECDSSTKVVGALQKNGRSCQWIQKILFSLAIISSLHSQPKAHADVPPPIENRSTFIIYFENDLFSGTDEYYTNALKLSWISKNLEKIGN